MSQDHVSDIAFTPAVKAEQDRRGSREGYRKMAERQDWSATVTADLAAFIAERDSFYLATATADGQPYLQHRGGSKGFLRVIDERTLGIADFGGNRQFISLGNLAENDKVCLFLMDYANEEPVRGMNTGCTASSRSWARMALRRDARSIASGGRRRPKTLKTRPFGSTQEARLPRRESANDAQASPAPPLLTLAPPGSMQPMFIPRTGS